MKNILLIIGIILIFSACPLILPDDDVSENCNGINFTFTCPVSFVPEDSLIHIGDTITVTSIVPAIMWDDLKREQLNFDSIDFLMGGFLFRLDTLLSKNDSYDFRDYFEIFVDSVFNFQQNASAYAFDYFYDKKNYSFSFKFLPKKRGVFLFEFNSLYTVSSGKRVKKIINAVNSPCKTNEWDIFFKTNNNSHRELLRLAKDEYYRTWYYDNWIRFENLEGGYCFKVE